MATPSRWPRTGRAERLPMWSHLDLAVWPIRRGPRNAHLPLGAHGTVQNATTQRSRKCRRRATADLCCTTSWR